jgi:hypothetical protein
MHFYRQTEMKEFKTESYVYSPQFGVRTDKKLVYCQTISYKFFLWRVIENDLFTCRRLNVFLLEIKARLLCLLSQVQIHSALTHAWLSLYSTLFSALVCLQILNRRRLLAHRPIYLITSKS